MANIFEKTTGERRCKLHRVPCCPEISWTFVHNRSKIKPGFFYQPSFISFEQVAKLHCKPKKTPKCFLIYSLQNLTDCDNILIHIVLSKFVVQKCKRFPSHVNNVSTLPRET